MRAAVRNYQVIVYMEKKEKCSNGVKTIRIYANVNPLEPNTFQVVDCSTNYCCAVSRYQSEIMPKQVRILKDKGFEVRVVVYEYNYLDVDNI